MSTRSIIGRPAGDGFEGRYHHSDGYPSGLGFELHRRYREVYGGDVARMTAHLIDEHPAGWSSLFDDRCYCHWQGREVEGGSMLTCLCPAPEDKSRCSPLSAEWAYVITPTGLWVYASVPTGSSFTEDTGERAWTRAAYVHTPVTLAPWDEDQIDWSGLNRWKEDREQALR